ncbi:hypothetical protein HK097_006002 [Rhizophlyctis rosea]|uniref:Uncharacterized protein n=1 Tax=Rhizophlyctis rosea TaxID=64517 RepID=A0AAD5X5W7_9FUNG|nr:hypothetical protein HK097_006002 [Rhizophlyctis rosea]
MNDLLRDAQGWFAHTDTELVLLVKIYPPSQGDTANGTFRLRVALYQRPPLSLIGEWEAGTRQADNWAVPPLTGPQDPTYQLSIPLNKLYDGAPIPAGMTNMQTLDIDLWELRRAVEREIYP